MMEVPYSRIFILNGTQNVSEDVIKDSFKGYGNVRAVKKIVDRQTQSDRKGLAYVRFSKASEAFLAVATMDGQMLPGAPSILKIVIATDKHSDEASNQKPINRIMVKIPRDWNREKVMEKFQEFGNVTDVHIPKKRDAQNAEEHKGYAFVEFEKAHCAAVALEECDSSFKPLFALPKGSKANPDMKHSGTKRSYDNNYSNQQSSGANTGGFNSSGSNFSQNYNPAPGNFGGQYKGAANFNAPPVLPPTNFTTALPLAGSDFRTGPPGYGKEGKLCLEVKPVGQVTQELIYNLFDVVPGMTSLEPSRNGPFYVVKYESANWADYARQKFNGMQLPGCRLDVFFSMETSTTNPLANVIQQLATAATVQNPMELQNLLANLQQQAASLTTPATQHSQGGMFNQGQTSSFGQTQGAPFNQAGGSFKQNNSFGQVAGNNAYSQNMNSSYNQGQNTSFGQMTSSGTMGANVGWGSNSSNLNYNQTVQQGAQYCDFPLPDKKPPSTEAPTVKLFIYSKDGELPEWVTNDLFCRFNGFHSVHWPGGKNYGFAQYVSQDDGQAVIDTLNGKTVAKSFLTLRFCDMNPKPKSGHTEDDEIKDEGIESKRPRY